MYALRIRYDTNSVPNWSLNTILTVRGNRAPMLHTHVRIASAYVANPYKNLPNRPSTDACSRAIDTVRPSSRLGTPIGETERRSGSHTSTEVLAPHRTPYIGLAHRCLVLIAALSNVVWLAIPTPFSYIGTLSPLSSCLLPCNHFKAFTPLSFRTACTILSPSSPEEPPANSTHRALAPPPTPGHRISFSLGGTPVPIAEARLLGRKS